MNDERLKDFIRGDMMEATALFDSVKNLLNKPETNWSEVHWVLTGAYKSISEALAMIYSDKIAHLPADCQ